MKICYFGIYDPEFSRNKIYIDGLRKNGVEVVECNDRSQGITKFWNLYKKHSELKNKYDVMIVGYPSQIVVLLAKLISSKKVILDALCSLYEGEVISRGVSKWSYDACKTWIIDYVAYRAADLVFVETRAQIDFFVRHFYIERGKCVRIFTGVRDDVFYIDPHIKKKLVFTVLFRGQFLPEAGIDVILSAAQRLQSEHIHFLFLGKDFSKVKVSERVQELGLHNVSVNNTFLSEDDKRVQMLSCHISLGQFARHSRLKRTIPHKAFETVALGLPYVTGRAGGILELLTDRENCLMVNLGDAKDLAEKILELKNDPILFKKIADNGHALYLAKLTPKHITSEIMKEIVSRGFVAKI